MQKITINCPFCEENFTVKSEQINQIVNCPNCKEEVFIEDVFEEQQSQEELSKQIALQKQNELDLEKQRHLWKRTNYKFLILGFDSIESTLNHWAHMGWKVVSQSTVFLSETNGSFGGFSAGSKVEGVAVILIKID